MNKDKPTIFMIATEDISEDIKNQIHAANYDIVIIHPKDYKDLEGLKEGAIKKFMEQQEIANYKTLPHPVKVEQKYESISPRRKRPRIQR
jgi:hypothetical protein